VFLKSDTMPDDSKIDKLIIILLAMFLIAGILLTAFCSARKSRHGYGNARPGQSGIIVSSLSLQRIR
jgi:hypothetical protein